MISVSITKKAEPVIPLRMNLVLNHPSFARLAYKTYVESKTKENVQANARLEQKWIRDIGVFENNSFSEALNVTLSPRNGIFQYKLVNRVLLRINISK